MTKAACFLLCALITAQAQTTNKLAPGNPAPELTLSKLLNAPDGAKVDWPSLKGKAVVLEFWATWCAPCIGEIPVLNALAAKVDPNKVVILSLDDEDTPLVESFLKKHPISGWIGLDQSKETLKRYNINSWPATFVIGPDGIIAANNIPPEQLTADQLLALADGKPVKLGGPVDPAVKAALDAATKEAFDAQAAPHGNSTTKPLFEITLTPADTPAGNKPMTHMMMHGQGQLDITDAPALTLLRSAAGIERSQVDAKLPESRFNLHVNAPNADPKLLNQAVEIAITSGTGIHVEHITKKADVYVLTAGSNAASHFTITKSNGGAWIADNHTLKCVFASPAKIAGGLEAQLEKPVVDETGITGRITQDFELASTDIEALNAVLSKELDLKLVPAQRTIETAIISAKPKE